MRALVREEDFPHCVRLTCSLAARCLDTTLAFKVAQDENGDWRRLD